ncbi:hypothetical protein EYF80_057528 [Liparis tanakae]|uniref:Uncharacterized protein n=1 Tax=Liparis tanakae TaxID=230148 RepID=A0A4Z2EVQ8_9TELE|nr:hypothetical protein EYF80_057528 [Liparis tanakae]
MTFCKGFKKLPNKAGDPSLQYCSPSYLWRKNQERLERESKQSHRNLQPLISRTEGRPTLNDVSQTTPPLVLTVWRLKEKRKEPDIKAP